jgi:hypothetical protein
MDQEDRSSLPRVAVIQFAIILKTQALLVLACRRAADKKRLDGRVRWTEVAF